VRVQFAVLAVYSVCLGSGKGEAIQGKKALHLAMDTG